MKRREKLYRELKKTSISDISYNSKELIFKSYKKRLAKIVNNSKNIYYQNKLNDCKNDCKKTWQIINELTKKDGKKSVPFSLFDHSGQIISNELEIANKFNQHFLNSSNTYSDTPCNIDSDYKSKYLPNKIFSRFKLELMQEAYLDKIISI